MNEEFQDFGAIPDVEARFADAFRVGYSAYKFTLDFGQLNLERKTTIYHTRVVIAPDMGKELFEKMEETIRNYQDKFDQIKKSSEI